jgi:hypothetical protein
MSNTKTVMSQAANTQGIPLDITDVFSTYLYTGTGAAQTITNGIDLAGEGGMVWVKNRDVSRNHQLTSSGFDVAGGELLFPNTTDALDTRTDRFKSFNSDGFTVEGGTGTGTIGEDYASWSFRKAPKFFDVVTYTGDGTDERDIAHNLGGPVGCLMVKCTSEAADWQVLHKDANRLILNSTSAQYSVANTAARFGDDVNIIRPTATHFTVSTPGNADTNKSGATYVAYLFAHNDGDGEFGPSGDQDIIKCGSGTINSFVDLGWEPQWVLVKTENSSYDWLLVDSMRGMTVVGTADPELKASSSAAEVGQDILSISPTGFTYTYGPAQDFIYYIAIRRGPLAPPESATEVFGVTSYTSNNTDNRVITTSNKVDTVLARTSSSTSVGGFNVGDRLRGLQYLGTAVTNADVSDSDSFMGFDVMKGFKVGNDFTRRLNYSSHNQIAYTWKRAPNFFDVVAYTGVGSQFSQKHNLGVTPQLIITKRRDSTGAWLVYTEGTGLNTYLLLDSSAAVASATNYSAVSDTHYTVPFGSTGNYVSYLFASLDGISKVGSYTGNGSSQTIDCGFTSGARFILIKRTDSTGDWYVWDTERGIVAGNDPHLSLNTTAAEVTSDDSIDPDNSGFIVNQVSATNINVSSADYIFYAIA